MSNYSIALSGLQNTSSAIDSVSNNISNANTVGYKAGEYLFADQFVRAVNPADSARVGMGTQTLGVRRALTQGTITNSSNPLDLAISGSGMFRLLKGSGTAGSVDPSAVYYTRNGQFAVDKEGYIVNENGLYLTGYQPSLDGESVTDDLIKNNGLLKMPNSNLPGNETTYSRLSALLDSTGNAFTSTTNVAFDPSQATYNNKTTQTLFDNEGNSHTLEVYYRRVGDDILSITSGSDGYTYSPSKSSSPNTLGDTLVTLNKDSVLRVDTPPLASNSAASVAGAVVTMNGIPAETGVPKNVQGMKIFANGVDTGATVTTHLSPQTLVDGQVTASTQVKVDAVTDVAVDQKVYVGGVDTGATVVNIDTVNKTVTLSKAISASDNAEIKFWSTKFTASNPSIAVPNGAALSFYRPNSSTTLTAQAANVDTVAVTSATGITVGDKFYIGGVDTGATVTGIDGLTVTLSKAVTAANAAAVTFKQNLNMTLATPDGTQITVQGATNKKSSGEVLSTTMARIEVYASVDGRFYNYDDAGTASNRDIDPKTPGTGGTANKGYRPVSELLFIGGKNIDTLATDAVSGNPQFRTNAQLSTRVTNQAGGTSDLVFDLDLTDTTLQAGAFQVTHSSQNGEPLARLTNVTVDNQGRIVGIYGTGKQQYIGQLALVHFDNFEGLMPVGKNAFAATNASGTEHSADGVVVGRAGTGIFGDIKAQALESSNVDLANELVRLMVLQRSYTANSQSMRAFDQTLRDTLQIIS